MNGSSRRKYTPLLFNYKYLNENNLGFIVQDVRRSAPHVPDPISACLDFKYLIICALKIRLKSVPNRPPQIFGAGTIRLIRLIIGHFGGLFFAVPAAITESLNKTCRSIDNSGRRSMIPCGTFGFSAIRLFFRSGVRSRPWGGVDTNNILYIHHKIVFLIYRGC